jgi:hypothetical protein
MGRPIRPSPIKPIFALETDSTDASSGLAGLQEQRCRRSEIRADQL